MSESSLISNSPNSLPDLLTVADLQKFLRISRGAAYALIHRSDFPSLYIGRAVRIPRDLLLRWVEQQAGGNDGR